jgi:hypothetical protein
MDLLLRGNLPLIEVQSYLSEGTMMQVSIGGNEGSLHETRINIKEEACRVPCRGVCSCSGASEVCQSDIPVEIGHRRWLSTRDGIFEVEHLSEARKGEATRNGTRHGAAICQDACRHPESRGKHGTRSTDRCLDELAARHHRGTFPQVPVTDMPMNAMRLLNKGEIFF